MPDLPDYYAILEVPETASDEEIRLAYKKQALLNHPDRLGKNASSTERQRATQQFQLVADAYYILGDPSRRASYDKSRTRGTGFSASSSSSWRQPSAGNMFADVFESMLRPEVERPSHVWRISGAMAGAVLGYIIGNLPGAAMGGVAGKTLGEVRDKKGVAVKDVFLSMSPEDRQSILTTLLKRILHETATRMTK